MRLLLDTHVWLWSLLEPKKLTRRMKEALVATDNELWLSPLSVWETLVLVEKGRVTLSEDAEQWTARALNLAPMREAPLTHAVVLESRRVRLPHRDPVDRFLAGTARVYELRLVTADAQLLRCRDIEHLPLR